MGTETPTVSVALCTYNGAAYVEEQLLSIFRQSFAVTELIIADDGSTDSTADVVDWVIAERDRVFPDTPLRVVRLGSERPLGVAQNFERALRACTGSIIAFCDQDDVWHDDRIERLIAVLLDSPETGLVHSDARLVDAAGTPTGVGLFDALAVTASDLTKVNEGRGFEVLLRRNIVTGATAILRASLRDRALPIPPGWIHDEWLAMVAAATGRTAAVSEPLIDYRQHGSNAIGAQSLTASTRISRLREPRQPRNSRLLLRARSLVERLTRLDGVSDEKIYLARWKFTHEGRRSALPRVRLLRVGGIVRGLLSGSYRRFGNGVQDALRDLVQPG